MWLQHAVLGVAVEALPAALAATAVSALPPQGSGAAPFPNGYYPGYAVPFYAKGAKSGQTSPPAYPAPWQDGSGGWDDAFAKAQAFVKQLTLIEKVNLTTGVGWEGERCVGQNGAIPRLGFRSMCMQDSPVGVRFTDYNSVFPAGGTVAASFDRGVWYQRGFGMGSEHRDKGTDVLLGPVVGPLGRSPEGGRNWEGFSPDPVLSGIAVAQSVLGIQEAGVIACTKHYVANEQERLRRSPQPFSHFDFSESISSNIDDVTMHELYLWPFADAVRAGTGAIMCSYNQVNNSYSCQNSYLLNHLLKNELGFQGFVMSDWSAQHTGVSSALAGLDMTMPGDESFDSGTAFWGANLTIAVLNGTVPMWRLNDMATRIVSAWYYVGRNQTQVPINFDSWTLDTYGFLHPIAQKDYQLVNEHIDVRGTHGAEIRDMAARSTVLLKNTGNALPLNAAELKFTGIFGDDAGPNLQGPNGCSDRSCDNGTLGMGWGSGTANFPYLVTPSDAISNVVSQSGDGIVQTITYNYDTSNVQTLAGQASVALVFVNADSGEGYIEVDNNVGDRNNLTLWKNGDELIKNVADYCNNTIVVIHSPGPVLLTTWYQHENVTGIVWAGIPGQESGNSIADVLYGRVNPGAKLPFTMGASRQEYGTDIIYKPNNGHGAPQDNFAEGVFIDYRAFDRHNIKPIYEFGYGLSYTTFSYSGLQVQQVSTAPYTPNTGMTGDPPRFGSTGTAADAVFPKGFREIDFYIYPYLNSTNLKKSSGDPQYGAPVSSYLPKGALNGTAQPKVGAGGAPGGNPGLYDVLYSVTATITNTGSVDGEEVPQLYISLGGPNDPKVALRNFERLSITAGDSATFTADLTRRDLSNWDTVAQNWAISSYPKTVYVGSSSRNLPLTATLTNVPQ